MDMYKRYNQHEERKDDMESEIALENDKYLEEKERRAKELRYQYYGLLILICILLVVLILLFV